MHPQPWSQNASYTVMYNMTILQLSSLIGLSLLIVLQWNPSIMDTIGTQYFVHYREISPTQGFPVYSVGVVLHNPAVEHNVAAFSELSAGREG